MNFIQEVLNLLERKQDKKKLDLKRDWFEFGRTRPSSVGNPLYTPKMNPHAIRYDDLKCNIISGLVSGTGTEHTLPMWSVIDKDNCDVQTMIDSIFSQDAGATEGLVSGNFRVTGDTVLEGNLLVLGTQTIVESTIVQVADNIMQINSGGGAFDAGIEVIQPSGTKTWAWDNVKNLWSTFDDSILTKDINISRAIVQDGEILVNVVNEAEGLASQDNDESYATVAAIIDWTDQMDLDVSADTGTPLDILLNSETLQIRGGDIITTNADGAEKIIISHDAVGVTVNNPSPISIDYGAQFPRKLVGAENVTHDGHGHLTGFWAERLVMPDWLGLTNVELNGNSLDFTSTSDSFGGFTGSIDLSGFVDEYTLVPDVGPTDGSYGIISLFENGVSASGFKVYGNEWIEISSDGAEMNIHHALAPDLLAAVSGVQLNHEDTFTVNSYVFDAAGHVIDLESVNYTLPASDPGTIVIANPGSPTADLTSISVDGVSYGIASTAADGNDFVDSVTLTGSDLIFTGSGDAFSGTIDLSGLSGTTYTASNGIELVASEFGLIDVARTNSSSIANPNHTDSFTVIDDITTNTKGQVTAVNVKTVTLPASGTGADGVITDVALNGNDLEFTGSNGGFNGVVDLSGYANAAETVTSLSINANVLTYTDENDADTNIDLSLYLDDTNLARLVSGTLDAGTGVATFTRDDATTFTLDLSSLLDTDTNTTYDYGAVGAAGNINFALSGSDGSNDVVTMQAGTNITLTDNGSNTFTIDAAGGVDTNTTYDLDSIQVGSDVAVTLVGSDATTDTVTLVAGTNITLTDDGSANITIDAAGGSDTTVACQSGISALNSTQSLTSTYASIQDGAVFPLGFENTSTEGRYYALTWTIEYGMSGTTGLKAFDTEVIKNGTTQLIEYKDSAYMASEYPVSRTYTYTTGILPNETIEIRVKGDTSLTLNKAHLTIIVNDCEANGSGEITILPPTDGGGDDPRTTVFTAEQYQDGNCNLSGNTIDVTGNLQIGDVFQDRGLCYIVTGLSGSSTGTNITSPTFLNCEQCNQIVAQS